MYPSVEQTVEQHRKAANALRERMKRDPGYAKAFLIKAGIAVESKTAPNGIRLAKRYRSAG